VQDVATATLQTILALSESGAVREQLLVAGAIPVVLSAAELAPDGAAEALGCRLLITLLENNSLAALVVRCVAVRLI